MDLNDIQVFTKVVEEGSFVAASKSLGIPRSTVSRRVSELERQLGARLLQRTTRRLHLTEMGETYFQYTTGIMAQIEEAQLAVTRLQGVPRGLLRVTAPMSFGPLGESLASYLKQYPEVQVEVVCTDHVVDLVQHGFDVAIRVGPLPNSTLIARTLGPLRSIIVASPDFLKKNGSPQVPSDLETVDCLLFATGSVQGTWTLRNSKRNFDVKVRSRYRANDMDFLREAAIAGLGVAMLPVHVCAQGIADGTLRRVLPDWCSKEIQVSALYPSARLLSPKLKVFLEHLQEHFQTTASD